MGLRYRDIRNTERVALEEPQNEVSTQFWGVNSWSDFKSKEARIMCRKLGCLLSATSSQMQTLIYQRLHSRYPCAFWGAAILLNKQRTNRDLCLLHRVHMLAHSSAPEVLWWVKLRQPLSLQYNPRGVQPKGSSTPNPKSMCLCQLSVPSTSALSEHASVWSLPGHRGSCAAGLIGGSSSSQPTN